MKVFRWFLTNGCFVSVLYMWFILEKDSVGIFAFCFCLFLLIASVLSCSEKVAIEAAKKDYSPSVPMFIDLTFDLSVTLAMVYYEAPFTAFIYFLHILFLQVAQSQIKEKRQCNQDEQKK